MVGSVFHHPFHITAPHQLRDNEGLALVLAEVEDSDDMGVGAEATHCLGFAGNSGAGYGVEALGFDEGEGHVPVEEGVVGQVDYLLAALAEEAFDLVASVGEGGGLVCDTSNGYRT